MLERVETLVTRLGGLPGITAAIVPDETGNPFSAAQPLGGT